MDKKIYNEEFHENRDLITRHTAETVVKILKGLKVNSIADVGGGLGTWLSVFANEFLSSEDKECKAHLYDGDYINPSELVIDSSKFVKCDLNRGPISKERYDLVICLEVAEHLLPERAESFVEDLTTMGDIVLFSAAIPHQGGGGHINEKPQSYWIELFERKGYAVYDIIRGRIQHDEDIPFWYKNNMFIFCSPTSHNKSELEKYGDKSIMLNWVQYELYEKYAELYEIKNNELKKLYSSKTYCIVNKMHTLVNTILGRKR